MRFGGKGCFLFKLSVLFLFGVFFGGVIPLWILDLVFWGLGVVTLCFFYGGGDLGGGGLKGGGYFPLIKSTNSFLKRD